MAYEIWLDIKRENKGSLWVVPRDTPNEAEDLMNIGIGHC